MLFFHDLVIFFHRFGAHLPLLLITLSHIYSHLFCKIDASIIVGSLLCLQAINLFIAFGCLDPEPPTFGFVERIGDRALVGCHISPEDTWGIICNGSEWTGNFGNCTMGN